MDSVYCIVSQTVRLSEPTRKTQLQTPLAYNNNLAHSMRVIVLEDDGTDADLTGVSVIGNMLRADGNTVFPITGTVTGNVAEVELPVSCYVVPGRFKFTLDLTIPRSTRDIDDFSTSKAYVKGDLVKRNGVVYRFVNDHAAGAWNDADVVADRHTRTAMWVEGYVERNISENIVDPGTPPGNIQAIIQQAGNAATAATTAAGQATTAATQADTARQGLQDVAFLGMSGATAITVDSDPTVMTDLNDIKTPGVYYAPSSVASAANMLNCPVKANFRMFVFYLSNGQIVNQIIIQRANNSVWMRNYTLSWTQWARLNTTSDPTVRGYGSAIDASNFGDNLTDADNAVPGVVYFLNQCINTTNDSKGWDAIANTPAGETGKSGFLVSAAGAISTNNKQSLIQLLFMTNDHIWYRRQVTNNWSNWIQLNEFFAETEINRYYVNTCVDRLKTKLTSSDKFVVFGDSIARGDWVSHFRNAIGISSGNAVNNAVSGAVWGHTDPNRPEAKWISTQVAGMESWADVKLVILAAGTNDADYSITTSEIRTQVQSVINTIKSNAPNAHMLFITPIRRGEEEKMKKLPAIAGAIANVALENDCSVINGFDIPIPANGITDVIDKLTSDAVHPTDIGHKIYARSVISFTQ